VQVPEGQSIVYVYWPWVRGLGYFPPPCGNFPLEERRDGLLSCTGQHANGAVSPERQEQFLELYRDRATDTIVDARKFGFWQRPTMWDSISCGESQSTWLRGGGYRAFVVPPGDTKCRANNDGGDEMDVHLNAGEEAYLKVVHVWRWERKWLRGETLWEDARPHLFLMDKETGKKQMENCVP